MTRSLGAIMDAALAAADPVASVEEALRGRVTVEHSVTTFAFPLARTMTRGQGEHRYSGTRVTVLAVGKAASGMARAALALLGDAVSGGLIVTTDGAGDPVPPLETLFAGHPLPDARGVEAARRAGVLVDRLGGDDLLLVLVSGGASALLADLPDLAPLEEMVALSVALQRSGADITEINTVRRAVATLKGGRLAARAAPARVVALLLSDVVGDDLAAIGSGLTVASPTTATDALAVLKRYHIVAPPGVAAHLRVTAPAPGVSAYLRPSKKATGVSSVVRSSKKKGLGPPDFLLATETVRGMILDPARVVSLVVGSGALAVTAAAARAESLGYRAMVIGHDLTGEAVAIAKRHADALRAAPLDGTLRAFISGGEATVTVRGARRGGPNQECALALALALEGVPGWSALMIDTDGRDGPTDAAGAVVDGATAGAIRAAGIDPAHALAENDAYTALDAADALLRTGPTGTNVNDLRIILAGSARHP